MLIYNLVMSIKFLIFFVFFSCRASFFIPESSNNFLQKVDFRELQFIKPEGKPISLKEIEQIQKDFAFCLSKQGIKLDKLEISLYFQTYWDDYISGYYTEKKNFFYLDLNDNRVSNLKIYLPGLVGLYLFYGILPIVPRAGKIIIYLDAEVKLYEKNHKLSIEEYDYYSSFYYGIFRTRNIEETFHKVYLKSLKSLSKKIYLLEESLSKKSNHGHFTVDIKCDCRR